MSHLICILLMIRTDTRGVNLNRVYSSPSVTLNPTIYAARKLILYAHLGREARETTVATPPPEGQATPPTKQSKDSPRRQPEAPNSDTESVKDTDDFAWEVPSLRTKSKRSSSSSRTSSSLLPSVPTLSPFKSDYGSQWYEMTENSRCSEGDESIADFSLNPLPPRNPDEAARFDLLAPSASPNKQTKRTNFLGALSPGSTKLAGDKIPVQSGSERLAAEGGGSSSSADAVGINDAPTFPPDNGESGLFMYIDIHGHASKRGIFIYGNHFEDTETKVDALLFPKLMSINSANFDFPACNFSQRNMFMKDRHTGAGREGSGRVSVYRATGITYCYTLECNFNTGRFTNTVPAASRDLGRATPPPVYDVPPKYTPAVYEETGKSLAISMLDLTESNPWSRLTCSPLKNLRGVRAWIGNYLKNSEAEAANKSKAVKNSPIRTRLRNLAGLKKTAVKQLALSAKSPKSPEAPRAHTKSPRKVSASKKVVSAKLGRQLLAGGTHTAQPPSLGRQLSGASVASSSSEARPGVEVGGLGPLRSRPGSGKIKTANRPKSSAPKTKVGTKSRSGSPRRALPSEVKGNKLALPPKMQTKRSSSKSQETVAGHVPGTPRLKKVKKKKIVPT